MTAGIPVRVERRRRGAFGLDDRRRPDPERVEAALRAFILAALPEVWALPPSPDPDASGRTLVLVLKGGHAAVLRIDRDRGAPSAAARAALDRCGGLRVPHALVSSLAEGRAALRRLGVEPRPVTDLGCGRPAAASATTAWSRLCRANRNP